jgi:hypothetical protein
MSDAAVECARCGAECFGDNDSLVVSVPATDVVECFCSECASEVLALMDRLGFDAKIERR